MKKIIFIMACIAGLILILRFAAGGEDAWICENGSWVKHGNPSYQKPVVSCRGKTPLPKNEKDCIGQGGTWRKLGPDPFESCNRKTIDRGNLCRDSSECEGRCQVSLTREELRQGMSGKLYTNKTFGHCSVWVIELGCQGIMKQGKPQVICFD